jgi:hypothetical protein
MLLLLVVSFGGSAAAEEALSSEPSPPRRAPWAKRPWIGEACRNEFFALCRDLPNGSRRDAIVACLKAHPESLSRECAEVTSDRQEQTHVTRAGRGGHRGRRMGNGGLGGGGDQQDSDPAPK